MTREVHCPRQGEGLGAEGGVVRALLIQSKVGLFEVFNLLGHTLLEQTRIM